MSLEFGDGAALPQSRRMRRRAWRFARRAHDRRERLRLRISQAREEEAAARRLLRRSYWPVPIVLGVVFACAGAVAVEVYGAAAFGLLVGAISWFLLLVGFVRRSDAKRSFEELKRYEAATRRLEQDLVELEAGRTS